MSGQGRLRHRPQGAASSGSSPLASAEEVEGSSPHHVRSSSRSNSPAPAPGRARRGFNLSREHLVVLVTGMCIGYLVLPMVLVQFIGPENLSLPTGNIPRLNVQRKMPTTDITDGSSETTPYNVRGGRKTSATDFNGAYPMAGSDVTSIIAAQFQLLSKQSIPTTTSPTVMLTRTLSDAMRKRILVTGGSGFVGSHLVDKLMMEGHEVVVVDNFFTGQKKNVEHWMHHPNFR